MRTQFRKICEPFPLSKEVGSRPRVLSSKNFTYVTHCYQIWYINPTWSGNEFQGSFPIPNQWDSAKILSKHPNPILTLFHLKLLLLAQYLRVSHTSHANKIRVPSSPNSSINGFWDFLNRLSVWLA